MKMNNPCPSCGTHELPKSIDVIKNAFRDMVVRVCSVCGYVFDRESCEAASGKKYPTHIRERECQKPDDKTCPMDEGAPNCEEGDDGIRHFRCPHYKMKPVPQR